MRCAYCTLRLSIYRAIHQNSSRNKLRSHKGDGSTGSCGAPGGAFCYGAWLGFVHSRGRGIPAQLPDDGIARAVHDDAAGGEDDDALDDVE